MPINPNPTQRCSSVPDKLASGCWNSVRAGDGMIPFLIHSWIATIQDAEVGSGRFAAEGAESSQ